MRASWICSAIIGTLEAGGYDGWYDMEIFSGEHYPDSLMKLDAAEMVRRGREGFIRGMGGPPPLSPHRGRAGNQTNETSNTPSAPAADITARPAASNTWIRCASRRIAIFASVCRLTVGGAIDLIT